MSNAYARKITFGRRVITADNVYIGESNLLDVLQQAIIEHDLNRGDIKYLYEYYKGRQPILGKTKTVRPEVNYKICENRANSIVSFKVGYTIGKPIQYVTAFSNNETTDSLNQLNKMMRTENKVSKDRKLVEWMMISGVGYRMILPKQYEDETPFEMYTLNPMNTFVVRANDYTERVLMGVTFKEDELHNRTYTAFTEDKIFTIKGGAIIGNSPNPIGMIPIIEYRANESMLGSFECVMSLLDAVNELDSNRLDSVAQFVESLLVLYNADIDEGTTANSIREAGMVLLKSVGDKNADIKVIAETINQTDNETLKKSFLSAINEIAGVPSQADGSTSDSSNNGAVVLRMGWQGAETRAQDFEAMFQEPERAMLSIVARICSAVSDFDFNPSDIDIKFTRRNYEALTEKSNTLALLLNTPYVHPKSAYEASGLFVDTQAAYEEGIKWQEEKESNNTEETVEVETVENVGENDVSKI